MDYWAIADITVQELEQFRDLYEMEPAFQKIASAALRVIVTQHTKDSSGVRGRG